MSRKIWKPESRKIYRYYNGEKEVAADPLRLQQRMARGYPKESTLEEDQKLFKLLSSVVHENMDEATKKAIETNHQKGFEAFDRLIQFARYAFEVKPYEEVDGVERGLTDAEVMELLNDYGMYVMEVKKNTPQTQKMPSCTESASLEKLPTNNDAG